MPDNLNYEEAQDEMGSHTWREFQARFPDADFGIWKFGVYGEDYDEYH